MRMFECKTYWNFALHFRLAKRKKIICNLCKLEFKVISLELSFAVSNCGCLLWIGHETPFQTMKISFELYKLLADYNRTV